MAYSGKHSSGGKAPAPKKVESAESEATLKAEFEEWCNLREEAREIFDRLSPREQEIAAMAAIGMSSRECADRLGISVKTVEKHRLSAYRRLEVDGLAGLIRIYLQTGLPDYPEEGE
ncbi:MAG UNVERIFIED_CONTAM: helix-turn-helix transcriptional regulator [Planctomycetaceae bacterium]|jgi:RNA polymerase sigma factor (sigma-70 family)